MLLLFYFFIAVGISFLCSILEAVLLSITPSYIKVLKKSNPKTGKLLDDQKNDMDRSIGAILTLNTFAHTLGAAGVGAEAVKLFGEEYMFFISAILTILILFLSEIVPKTIGAYYWKELGGISARIIRLFVFITSPLLYIMQKVTAMITSKKESSTITKDEIVATANIGEEAGIIKQKESSIIENLLQMDKIKIKDIHTPRRVMFSISKEDLIKVLNKDKDVEIDFNKLKEYSRVPVYGENIDDILGMVFSKEFFHEYINDELKDKSKIIRPIFNINENIHISKLLDMFLSKKEHMFLVVDNYDQTEGIVTLEDAVETLLGREIVDELDLTVDMRELAKAK
jgi:CBS domain containing-hemolysin-like protein